MWLRKQAATTHRTPTVIQATGDVLSAQASGAPGTPDGTMSLVWLIAEWNRTTKQAAAGSGHEPGDGHRGCSDLEQVGGKRLPELVPAD